MQEVQQLELSCKQFYECTDPLIRSKAEKILFEFLEDPDALNKCQLLLDRGESAYAQLLAATTLTKLVSRNVQGLSLQQRVDIRNYILNYLATRSLQSFVTQALIALLAKITKYGWFDSYKDEMIFRQIDQDVKEFLKGSVEHCMIGVKILSQLVSEMNQIAEMDVNLSFTRHRKIACSFRDTQLFDIFLLSCELLARARDNSTSLNLIDETQQGLIMDLLQLAKNCLSFDFIGTSADESTDDMTTVQVPTNWRSALLEQDSLKLFFDLYQILPPRISSLALTCLVQITSIRRSIFSNNERIKFLNCLVAGAVEILKTSHGLSEPNNYHEFCRLLARLKSNYQLGELVVVDNYAEAIQLIAKFTVQSLQIWQFSPNSVHYLLSLWQRMVTSVPYVKAQEPHYLNTYTPEVVKAYITSRLDEVTAIVRENLDDPLDDLGMVVQQLEQLSTIERCEYEKTCALLFQLFDQTAAKYQEILSMPSPSSIELQIVNNQLTWLVYILGSCIGGRICSTATEEHDSLDGDLIIRVLQLMSVTDSRLPQGGFEKMEIAFMNFLEMVRKIYINEHTQKLKVYKRLAEVLGVGDESMMLLGMISRKIITNLKYWGNSELIIRKTLNLLNDLTLTYSLIRRLVKLDEIQFMLANHTSEYFSFLGAGNMTNSRCRSIFYTCLGRLLILDLNEDVASFETFMLPLTNAFDSIGQVMMNSIDPGEQVKSALIGLARDIRGLAYSFNQKAPYMMFFDWIYPTYSPILIRAVEIWAHDPSVTTPVLKFFGELVQNRSQRLVFDVSSPNGYLLFRETSKLICCYGNRVLNIDVPKDQIYQMRFKGISVCFLMLKAILCGNYVNLGVFKLYGDNAFDSVMAITAKLILSIPHKDLLEYPKLSTSYYILLECLAQDHIKFLSTLEPTVFLYILESISEGLNALDLMIISGCCVTLDNILSYIFKQKTQAFPTKKMRQVLEPETNMFLEVTERHPEILQRILSTLLNVVIFEDCKNQWSMSRPLFVLILLYEDYFRQLRDNIIRSQPLDKQQQMTRLFEILMEGVERNLLTKSRDRFTQNLSIFRREINDSMKTANLNMNDMIVS
ncbi:exportin-7 isoform X2 [Chironomus tepperi]|uniref:exportin-7 isoform X2 n=1 Tax=Chironomus tepperi TaxID=113505 RepID=UPI00391F0763